MTETDERRLGSFSLKLQNEVDTDFIDTQRFTALVVLRAFASTLRYEMSDTYACKSLQHAWTEDIRGRTGDTVCLVFYSVLYSG